jgi:hypothetical protein
VAVVAAAYVATAAAGGGYSPQFRAAAALLVWAAVIAGLALGVWPRARIPRRALIAGGGLLAMTVLAGLSMTWAADQGAAFTEAVRTSGYLGLFALVVIASPAGSARLWLVGLAFGLVTVSALALGSRIYPSLFPHQDLATFLPGLLRLSYPLNYWNALGGCMALAVVLLTWLGAHATGRAGRALAVAAGPVPALALYLTSSRGAVVALAVGLGVLLAVGPGRVRLLAGGLLIGAGSALLVALAGTREAFVDGRLDATAAPAQGREMLLALLLVAAGAGALRLAVDRPLARLTVPRGLALAAWSTLAVALVVGVVAADPAKRLNGFKAPPAPSLDSRRFVATHLTSPGGAGRYQFWGAGLDAFRSEPLRGIGAGGYETWWAQHGSLAYFVRDAHSLPVETLAELGVLGLLALLVFLGGAVAGGIAARASHPRAGPVAGAGLALLACGATTAAVEWTWEVPAAFAPLVLVAALLCGPAGRVVAPAAAHKPRFGLGIATLGLAWIAVIAATIALVAEVKLSDSRAAARRGDLKAAASDALAARAVAPWSGTPWLQLALVRERRGDLAGARRAADAAAARDAEDSQVWLVITRLAVRAGDVQGARRALRRARMLNPRSPLFAPTKP